MTQTETNDLSLLTDQLIQRLYEKGFVPHNKVSIFFQKSIQSITSIIYFLTCKYILSTGDIHSVKLVLKIPKRQYIEIGEHESKFYQTLAVGNSQPFFIKLYDTGLIPDTQKNYLLLEDVSATHYQVEGVIPITKNLAEQVVDCLATFHANWWGNDNLIKNNNYPDFDKSRPYLTQALDAFPAFVDFLSDRLSLERCRIYEKIFSNWPPKVLTGRMQEGKNITLVHGDSRQGNFLFPNKFVNSELKIVDWQDWHINVGPNDLANLIAKDWYPERRKQIEEVLIGRYHSRLIDLGIKNYPLHECWVDYRIGVIRCLFWPIVMWSNHNVPDAVWWSLLEKNMSAFNELRCIELLES